MVLLGTLAFLTAKSYLQMVDEKSEIQDKLDNLDSQGNSQASYLFHDSPTKTLNSQSQFKKCLQHMGIVETPEKRSLDRTF
mmetsp:Transcript_10825/g.10951  ORF Transcript_10825/g.10951 Transcript_10825/m.10951 type:complete len:81 (+) Transcript_10825:211-453(+)